MTIATDWINAVAATLAAVFTVIIGGASLAIACFAGKLEQAQLKVAEASLKAAQASLKAAQASLYPFMDLEQTNKRNELCISISNHGNGPAIITKVKYVKGTVSLEENEQTVEHGERYYLFTTNDVAECPKEYLIDSRTVGRLPGTVIKSGDNIVLLHLIFGQNGRSSMASVIEPWQGWLNEARNTLDNTSIIIEYKDALGIGGHRLEKLLRYQTVQ
jgi:hypothetical protein